MTLFKISCRNIKKNMSNYFLYLFSMIFSVTIYVVFVSLKYNPVILSESDESYKFKFLFGAAAYILLLFVAIFIWYTNAFFIRNRKKEVGLYSLLGVQKRQIGLLLFFENSLIGLIALGAGIGIGIIASNGVVALLLHFLSIDGIAGNPISFSVISETAKVFVIITLFTSLQGYFLVYRFKLIDLFHAEKQPERKSHGTVLAGILSVILLGIGYWLALLPLDSKPWEAIGLRETPAVILIVVIIGTYLFFTSVTTLILKFARKNKKHDWKGINLLVYSGLFYRVKSNARTLATIAILSAVTISAVGVSYNIFYNNLKVNNAANPNTINFASSDISKNSEVKSIIESDPNHSVERHFSVPTLVETVDISDLGLESILPQVNTSLISDEVFNQLNQSADRNEQLQLDGNQAVVLDPFYSEQYSPKYTGHTLQVVGKEQTTPLEVVDFKKYSVFNAYTARNVIVVSNELFDHLSVSTVPSNYEVYQLADQKEADEVSEKVSEALPETARFSAFPLDYQAGLISKGLTVFTGVFLGLVFLTATGSILYFKFLSEANAEKERYTILYKLGTTKREIRRIISRQALFIFAFPLLLGIGHSTILLKGFSEFAGTSFLIPAIICIIAYALIYFIYYLLTVHSYFKIVMGHKNEA